MNRESPGNTKADRDCNKFKRYETPEQQLARLKKELTDLRSPDHYKGWTQEQLNLHIEGHQILIASIEKRLSPER
jgi:3-mercaptopyruvate sulfurtransferase SseA